MSHTQLSKGLSHLVLSWYDCFKEELRMLILKHRRKQMLQCNLLNHLPTIILYIIILVLCKRADIKIKLE